MKRRGPCLPTPKRAVFIPTVFDYGHGYSYALRCYNFKSGIKIYGKGPYPPDSVLQHLLLNRFWRFVGAE
jgi:hypothetical protein